MKRTFWFILATLTATMLNAQTRTATETFVQRKIDEATADLDGKRDKTDLKVYETKVSHSLDDAALPITWQYGGATYTNAIIDAIDDMGEGVFLSFSAEASGSFGGEAVKVYFDEVGVASSIQTYSSATYFFGGKPYKTGEWPRLKTTAQPTGDTLATTSTVAQVAREVVNTVWDEKLGVAWEARMHNGHLYYIAVTNRQEVTK